MLKKRIAAVLGATLLLLAATAHAQGAAATPAAPTNPAFDPALAQSVGANENGMRAYVFVILKTGPTPVPAGPQRNAMFEGHFANMNRLVKEGKLAVAGPLDGVEGRRGLFIFAAA